MSIATPPSSARRLWRGMLQIQPPTPRRWLFALRSSACMGAPVVAGVLAGEISAGLMAAIGGFTALYGSGRPYLSRARHLGVIAGALALAVGLGLWAGSAAWAAISMVALIAMLATWLGNALQVGPPGAYMFVLACAAGTAMPAAHLTPLHAATLVLAGGAFAWLVHMGGAIFAPHGPERSAVAVAGTAVIQYVDAIGGDREGPARHRAAFTLHRAWSVLVSQQPARARANGTLSRLRTLNRELHLRFAEAMGAAGRQSPLPAGLRNDLGRLLAQVRDPRDLPGSEVEELPLGHPSARAVLLEALQPGSNARRVILRVGVATVFAGVLGAAFHLDRAYWAIAAAVLMLHQGFDWLRMVQRSIERLLGTWVGLLLAGAILLAHPQGLWLALVVMGLQFTIDMVVVRNYTLGVVFITGVALTIASGGHPVASPGSYLLARGVDTLAGCLVALLVFRLIPPRASGARIPEQLVRSLQAVDTVVAHLAAGTVTTVEAKFARRRLLHAGFALTQAYEEGLAASRQQRRAAEHSWPAIAATERIAYRVLSNCWALEHLDADAARAAGGAMFAEGGATRVRDALGVLIAAVRDGGTPPPLPAMPPVLATEIDSLRDCLVEEPHAGETRP